jgi:hypothetical protein
MGDIIISKKFIGVLHTVKTASSLERVRLARCRCTWRVRCRDRSSHGTQNLH